MLPGVAPPERMSLTAEATTSSPETWKMNAAGKDISAVELHSVKLGALELAVPFT